MTARSRLVGELREAGWPAVAEDVDDGVPYDEILVRLREIGEGSTDAAELVAAAHDDQEPTANHLVWTPPV